jgi:Bacterial mobilisation protein (MobC)
MQSRVHLTTWVSREAKERFGRIAGNEGLSESALLRRIVETTVVAGGPADSNAGSTSERVVSSGRVSVRLRQDDLALLRERATARDLPTSTYISYLVRAHLRAQTPLPTAELEALKRSVAEIGAIGRNINQIARAVNQQQWPEGPSQHYLLQMIRVLTGMRDHIKSLINANLASWSTGHAKTND